MVQLDDRHRGRLAVLVEGAVGEVAAQILGLTSVEQLVQRRRSGSAREVALAQLAVAEEIAKAAGGIAAGEAVLAAGAGATYGDLGTAAGISRQGARRRWPGLAETAAAARRNNRPKVARPTQREVGRHQISRFEREIQYEITVPEWTVGQLREALQPAPAEIPVVAVTAEEPGGDHEGPTQVVRRAQVADSGGDLMFALELDLPTGRYRRRKFDSTGEVAGEVFDHEAQAVTVGEVLAALDGVADDVPVRAWPVDEQGDTTGIWQVVYDGAVGVDWSPPARGEKEGEWVTAARYDLQLEYPAGRYCRYQDTDGEADQ